MEVAEQARAFAARLPRDVRDALADLYTEAQRAQWEERYLLTCRRKRKVMVYLALKEAGYPTSGYT